MSLEFASKRSLLIYGYMVTETKKTKRAETQRMKINWQNASNETAPNEIMIFVEFIWFKEISQGDFATERTLN